MKTKTSHYIFTIHYQSENEKNSFEKVAKSLEKHRYICYGYEICPETKRPHIQGYIQLKIAQRLTFLHNYFAIIRDGKKLRFHIEPTQGSLEDNQEYCSKEGKFKEFGEPVAYKGARVDLVNIKDKIDENPKNIKKIIKDHVTNIQQLKFAQSYAGYCFEERDPDNPPKVFWIFGASGVGKTKLVYDTFDDICAIADYKWIGTNYLQNECLLFDDFRENNISFELLLKITDRYPHTLQVKFGHIPLNSPFIIITSPYSIETAFPFSDENLVQLTRRVTQINLDEIPDISEIDLRNLDEKHIYKADKGSGAHW